LLQGARRINHRKESRLMLTQLLLSVGLVAWTIIAGRLM
jgi:hypothetical protein